MTLPNGRATIMVVNRYNIISLINTVLCNLVIFNTKYYIQKPLRVDINKTVHIQALELASFAKHDAILSFARGVFSPYKVCYTPV